MEAAVFDCPHLSQADTLYPGEDYKTSPCTDRWMCLVEIFQHMWQEGDILQELGWTFLVLIPKTTTDTSGIVLLEILWKVVEAPVYTRLRASLQFHDDLHRFQA